MNTSLGKQYQMYKKDFSAGREYSARKKYNRRSQSLPFLNPEIVRQRRFAETKEETEKARQGLTRSLATNMASGTANKNTLNESDLLKAESLVKEGHAKFKNGSYMATSGVGVRAVRDEMFSSDDATGDNLKHLYNNSELNQVDKQVIVDEGVNLAATSGQKQLMGFHLDNSGTAQQFDEPDKPNGWTAATVVAKGVGGLKKETLKDTAVVQALKESYKRGDVSQDELIRQSLTFTDQKVLNNIGVEVLGMEMPAFQAERTRISGATNPNGSQGPQGPQGPAGPQGPPPSNTPTPGAGGIPGAPTGPGGLWIPRK